MPAKNIEEERLWWTQLVCGRYSLSVTDTYCLWQTWTVCDKHNFWRHGQLGWWSFLFIFFLSSLDPPLCLSLVMLIPKHFFLQDWNFWKTWLVALLITDPSPNSFTRLSWKKKKKKSQVTRDVWHMTHNMWHVGGGEPSLKSSAP